MVSGTLTALCSIGGEGTSPIYPDSRNRRGRLAPRSKCVAFKCCPVKQLSRLSVPIRVSSGSKAKAVRDQSRSGASIEIVLSFELREGLFRYGGGGPLRRYARLVGAPNSAPSLCSVAGLLLAVALQSGYADPLRLPSKFDSKLALVFAPVGAHFELVAHFSHELRARERAELRSASR